MSVRRSLAALCLAGMAMAHTISWAAVPQEAAAQLARESGLWEQLKSVPAIAQEAASQTAAQMSGSQGDALEILRPLLQRHFAAERLQQQLLRYLPKKLQPEDLDVAMRWYQSGTGQMITAMEVASSTPDALKAMRGDQGAKALMGTGPARRELVRRMAVATGSAEFLVVKNTAIAISMAQGAMAEMGVPEEAHQALQEARETADILRPAQVGAAQVMVEQSMALSYAGVSDQELSEYLAFLESAAGQRVTKAMLEALIDATADSAQAVGRDSARAMKRRMQRGHM